jgi:hypothetical protein
MKVHTKGQKSALEAPIFQVEFADVGAQRKNHPKEFLRQRVVD